jgi:hypothetical protein
MHAPGVWTLAPPSSSPPRGRVWTLAPALELGADTAVPTFVTFADVDDYVRRVDAAVTSLGVDIASHPDKAKADPGLARAWAEWVVAWEALKADIDSMGTRFFQAPATKYDEVEIKDQQFIEFRGRWGKAGIQANAPTPGGPVDKPTGESSTTGLVRLGIGVVGLAAFAWLVRG